MEKIDYQVEYLALLEKNNNVLEKRRAYEKARRDANKEEYNEKYRIVMNAYYQRNKDDILFKERRSELSRKSHAKKKALKDLEKLKKESPFIDC